MDKLIFCNDLDALKAKLKEDGHVDVESGAYTIKHTLTPLKYKGNTSLSYVRDLTLDLAVYTMLEDLGDYDDMFADTTAHDKYKSVYPYDIPIEFIDGDGTRHTYTLPKKIGDFAK